MTLHQEEQAVRHALDATAGMKRGELHGALIVLRTVACHLDLGELHAEIERRLQDLRDN